MNRFTTSDGLSLAYHDAGSGPVVLCLAGLTRNSRDFGPLLAPATGHVADGIRLIRLDSRGRGDSDFDPDFTNYSVAVEARDALELLDHLGLDRAAIFGTSRGGILALAIAAVAPQRLSGVLLNDIGPDLDPEGITRILTYLGLPPPYPDLDTAAAKVAEINRARFPDATAADWRRYLGHAWEETEDGLALRYDPKLRDAFEAQMEAGAAADLWPFFDALPNVPLALLRGSLSDVISRDCARAMQERRPDMVWTEVPGRGHVPFLDEPAAIDAMRGFFASLSR